MTRQARRAYDEHNDRLASRNGAGGAGVRFGAGHYVRANALRLIQNCVGRRNEAEDVYEYLMRQNGWLPDDYVFDREEANAR